VVEALVDRQVDAAGGYVDGPIGHLADWLATAGQRWPCEVGVSGRVKADDGEILGDPQALAAGR
jgi:hypothetical protein